ncbi:hypothetical protein Asp14428_41860 [Actinoplanes sp. NBRC 14428]|nr:hypothetical protein Asp14428_41860 [Actinoplanes sp. NBRC 14428]
MTEQDTEAARLHRELLLLAGRVPDDLLARARSTLAEGRPDVVAAATAGLAGREPELPYAFAPALPTDGTPTPVLDLTGVPAAELDPVDRAAVRALVRVPEAVALWRAWRLAPEWAAAVVPPARVYVLEAQAPADTLPAVTAAVMRDLVRAGEQSPRVETYPVGAEPGAYQLGARSAGALLWTARDTSPVRLAGPGDNTRLDPAERPRVLACLRAGTPIVTTTRLAPDDVEPGRGRIVPMNYRTDGRWVWSDSAAYYLRTYGLAPDPGLLADFRAAGYAHRRVDSVGTHRALAALFRPEPARAS